MEKNEINVKEAINNLTNQLRLMGIDSGTKKIYLYRMKLHYHFPGFPKDKFVAFVAEIGDFLLFVPLKFQNIGVVSWNSVDLEEIQPYQTFCVNGVTYKYEVCYGNYPCISESGIIVS